MAHFALLNKYSIVQQVLVVDNADSLDLGKESELKGVEYLSNFIFEVYPDCVNIVQTSYNGKFRRKFAGIGDFYDKQLDCFIEPQPFASWGFDPDTKNWTAPVPIPNDGNNYFWNEEESDWVKI